MTAAPTELHAGPLTLELDGADLRYVAYRGEEIVRRIYMAVRDPDWNTVPAVITGTELETADDSFRATVELENRGFGLAFDWQLEASGDPSGIEYVMRAEAKGSFEFAKIGLNIHHPIAGLAGRPWSGISPQGPLSGVMSERIYRQLEVRSEGWHPPQLPPLSELTLDHEVGTVKVSFGGGLYEMEDQRNWSDASYKTYSLPAELGYEFHAAEGENFEQRVRIEFSPRPGAPSSGRAYAGPPRETAGELRLGAPGGRVMPSVGIAHSGELDESAAERLAALGPAHLRLDVRFAAADWERSLESGLAACARLSAAAELALHLARDPRRELARLAASVRESGVPVARVIVLLDDEESTPAGWVALVRETIGLDAPIGGGTDLNFNELNRTVPDLRPFEVLSWPLNPQVHAFSDRDLVENLDGQRDQVRSGRAIAGDREIVISPLSLKPRFNAVAREDASPADNIDARQSAPFAAAWTLGSLTRLAGAGLDSVTYYETTGPRGVLSGEETFPLYHVLADACELRGAPLRPLTSVDEPWLCGLAAEHDGGLVALVANLTDHERRVRLTTPADAALELDLGPYASARLELT